MGDPPGGILGRDGPEGGPDGGAVVVEGPWLGAAQGGLDLREGLLDRVVVRRVGREEPELRPAGLDRRAGTVAVVDREVVGDDDLAALERRDQPMDDVAVERLAVERLV